MEQIVTGIGIGVFIAGSFAIEKIKKVRKKKQKPKKD